MLTHMELVGILAILAVGLIAACALMGYLDEPSPGDAEHEAD